MSVPRGYILSYLPECSLAREINNDFLLATNSDGSSAEMARTGWSKRKRWISRRQQRYKTELYLLAALYY